jgi:tetraacyldisaccharide 4'-kinase
MRAPEFWTSHTWTARVLGAALSPLGALYDLGGRIRFATTRPQRVKARVICVGNLTAGGTGKTPIAIAIAERLKSQGAQVAFLSRGYRGALDAATIVDPQRHSANEVGDEPLLLARTAMTIVSSDRVAGARLAVEAGAKIIVMDDGFQNPSLHKDISLIVVDGVSQFGNGLVIPAGPLRENVQRGLKRATAVIAVGGSLEGPFGDLPVLSARLQPDAAIAASLKGKRVVAFAGIGRPAKFFATLTALGAEVVLARSFPDHYAFRPADWAQLAVAAEAGTASLVTTEKDWVRLDANKRARVIAVPVKAVFSDPSKLDEILSKHG